MATKTTTKKAEPKTTTASKAVEKEAPAKAAAKTATTAAATTAEKAAEKAPAKKTAAAKKTAEKTTVKKTAEKKPAARRTAKKAAALNTEVYVQFWGKEVYAKDVVESIKKFGLKRWARKRKSLLTLKYISNQKTTGHIMSSMATLPVSLVYDPVHSCLCGCRVSEKKTRTAEILFTALPGFFYDISG